MKRSAHLPVNVATWPTLGSSEARTITDYTWNRIIGPLGRYASPRTSGNEDGKIVE
jgi:hypothetical protein